MSEDLSNQQSLTALRRKLDLTIYILEIDVAG